MHVALTSGRAATRCTTFCGKGRRQRGPRGSWEAQHISAHFLSRAQSVRVGERLGGNCTEHLAGEPRCRCSQAPFSKAHTAQKVLKESGGRPRAQPRATPPKLRELGQVSERLGASVSPSVQWVSRGF